MRAYIKLLPDNQVHWLLLAKFAYNNSIHASTGITLFFAEKSFHPSIETTV
jgi:hypothetical protein